MTQSIIDAENYIDADSIDDLENADREYFECLKYEQHKLDSIKTTKFIDGTEVNCSFSDLNEEEMRKYLTNLNREEILEIAVILGLKLKSIGEELDVYGID